MQSAAKKNETKARVQIVSTNANENFCTNFVNQFERAILKFAHVPKKTPPPARS